MSRVTFFDTKFRGRAVYGAEMKGPKSSIAERRQQVTLLVYRNGGNIAQFSSGNGDARNILWETPWRTRDPQDPVFDSAEGEYYGNVDERRLLGSLGGSALCFPFFGPGALATGGLHGGANLVEWTLCEKGSAKGDTAVMALKATLSLTGWEIYREFTFFPEKGIVKIRTEFSNTKIITQRFTCAEHMNFGVFAEGSKLYLPGGTTGHTFPADFGENNQHQLLEKDEDFHWPFAPMAGNEGERLDLSTFSIPGIKAQSDFTTQHFSKTLGHAWFLLHNGAWRKALVCAWPREQAPFLGMWKEYLARDKAPWADGDMPRTKALGLEFAKTPFPEGIDAAVKMGTFMGEHTFAEVGPKRSATMEFYLRALPLLDGHITHPQNIVERAFEGVISI